jgi:hypothetical protein
MHETAADVHDFLRHHGHPVALTLMGTSIGGWVADHGMALLSAAGIVTSIVIQVLTYRLRRRETLARLQAPEQDRPAP